MIREDYSENAELYANEFYDYDTVDFNTTGINFGRARLPSRYDISKYYKRRQINRHKKVTNFYGEEEKVLFRKGEDGKWLDKNTKDLLDFSKDFDWQITYEFPFVLHYNTTFLGKKYGGKNVTYRRLYLILCERFNDGEYFIDEYFNSVYPYTVKERVDLLLENYKEYVLRDIDFNFSYLRRTRSGAIIKRQANSKKLKAKVASFEDSKNFMQNDVELEISHIIKKDIIDSLMKGTLPLKHINSEYTKRRRKEVGIESNSVFYATGNLIKSLQLYVKIGDKQSWKTSLGIQV